MSRPRSSRDLSGLLRRRRWTFLSVALAGLGAAGAASLVLPKSWEATARIEVTPNGSLDAAQLAAKADEVRAQLLASSESGPDATRVERDPDAPGGVCLLQVGSVAAHPAEALGALARLVKGCEDDVYAEPREHAHKVAEAKRAEFAAAEAYADEAARALVEYETTNEEILRPLDADLAAVQKEIRTIEEESLAVWKQKLQQATELLTAEQAYTKQQVRRPDAARLASVDAEIEAAQARLADLTETKKLGDDHADVIQARTTLADLQKQRRAVEESAAVGEVLQPNPIHADYTKLRDEARSELTVVEARLAGLRRNEKRLSTMRTQAPPVRAQRERLAAECEEARRVLEERRAALQVAETSLATIDERRQVNLRIVEAPRAPDTPVGPGPLLFALGGLAAGALVGLGVVVTLDVTDRSFRDAGTAAAVLGVPALGVIGTIETEADVRARRRDSMRRAALVGLLALAAIGIAGVAVVSGGAPAVAPAAMDSAGGR